MSLPTDEVRHETDEVRHETDEVRHGTEDVRREAAKLFKAVQEAAADWSHIRARDDTSEPAAGGTTGDEATGDGATADGTTVCRGCPLCQLLAHVRGTSPEVVDHLADAVSSLSAAVSELFATSRPAAGRDRKHAPPAATHPPPAGRREPEPFQHIDISD